MLKTVALGIVLFILTVIALPVSKRFNQVTAPRLIYRADNLPAFNEVQNFLPNTYLSMVRLESKEHGFFCSGAVISDDYVLTAAHCLMEDGVFPDMNREEINVVSIPTSTGMTKTSIAYAAALNNRADYALIRGDFREFTKIKILVKPNMTNQLKGPIVTCGFPWGAESVCYSTGNKLIPYFERYKLEGRLYPGMSGGPVIDASSGSALGVNAAVMDGGIAISPLIGLFETLGVEVVK